MHLFSLLLSSHLIIWNICYQNVNIFPPKIGETTNIFRTNLNPIHAMLKSCTTWGQWFIPSHMCFFPILSLNCYIARVQKHQTKISSHPNSPSKSLEAYSRPNHSTHQPLRIAISEPKLSNHPTIWSPQKSPEIRVASVRLAQVVWAPNSWWEVLGWSAPVFRQEIVGPMSSRKLKFQGWLEIFQLEEIHHSQNAPLF